ncbi:hypothetical protein MESS2_650076 [Mesorhizobium metallidurans STM 2683]|uniref:Transposase n=1 Tax=Mesorhizobium metallidurans STM 2683 TaxID=1297569 RepID=M5F7J5_9HYPH|nr:hypothetical protein MESS2_650076 [Mesorhizobium metallidurans STM 2683]
MRLTLGLPDTWSSLRFRATQILTDWTNVSTAVSAVKGLLAEMRHRKRAPQAGEKLVQRIGPDGPRRGGAQG